MTEFDCVSHTCWNGRATGSTAQIKLATPPANELGFAELLTCEDIGGSNVIVLRQPEEQGKLTTLVLRGSTDQLLDDLERAVDDGVNTYKVGLVCHPLIALPQSPISPLSEGHVKLNL